MQSNSSNNISFNTAKIKLGSSTLQHSLLLGVPIDRINSNENSSKNNKRTPFLYDDIAWHLNFYTFFLQLFAHIIPFGFFAVHYFAQGFIQKSILFSAINILSPFIVCIMVVAYLLCEKDEGNTISQGIYLPILLFLTHKVLRLFSKERIFRALLSHILLGLSCNIFI